MYFVLMYVYRWQFFPNITIVNVRIFTLALLLVLTVLDVCRYDCFHHC